MKRLKSIDERVFPIMHQHIKPSNPFSIERDRAYKKENLIHSIEQLITDAFVDATLAPCSVEYEGIIRPYIEEWRCNFRSISRKKLTYIFDYVYIACSTDDFYKNRNQSVITSFLQELSFNSKLLPLGQVFFRGVKKQIGFQKVGDEITVMDRPLSMTLLPDVAASHADRNSCNNFGSRFLQSTIYVITNKCNKSKGYVVNHDDVDVNDENIAQMMEHEFEIILSPPYKLKINLIQVIGDYEFLHISIEPLP
ncbi:MULTISPECIES: hypothetical protein [Acinetobacter]|uniref:hypothetical protein n=1 Tax=Acinetobacter TaxID=469 RepID=UPI00141A711D|nr:MULTISPECIES: hypothetical protein [Acinetobacter]MCS4298905.1 hypothetical protein [Acinetobacter guillouiae]MCW2252357.1 hypothetical protein [Acinetobacter sp. BIGb0204]NII38056.1 hypothetical protein [Acinetobacter sp. BIGb0196]